MQVVIVFVAAAFSLSTTSAASFSCQVNWYGESLVPVIIQETAFPLEAGPSEPKSAASIRARANWKKGFEKIQQARRVEKSLRQASERRLTSEVPEIDGNNLSPYSSALVDKRMEEKMQGRFFAFKVFGGFLAMLFAVAITTVALAGRKNSKRPTTANRRTQSSSTSTDSISRTT